MGSGWLFGWLVGWFVYLYYWSWSARFLLRSWLFCWLNCVLQGVLLFFCFSFLFFFKRLDPGRRCSWDALLQKQGHLRRVYSCRATPMHFFAETESEASSCVSAFYSHPRPLRAHLTKRLQRNSEAVNTKSSKFLIGLELPETHRKDQTAARRLFKTAHLMCFSVTSSGRWLFDDCGCKH